VHLVGARAPLHTTAVGKLFMVEDGPQKVREYAKRTGLPGFTPTSLTSLGPLEKELDRVRRHGVAFDNEEIEQGLRCIAAPVRDDSGELVAGLSVSAPADRYSIDWVPLVKRAAEDISRALGYVST
jgi:DNA-binding IclR family transcriptional regulator